MHWLVILLILTLPESYAQACLSGLLPIFCPSGQIVLVYDFEVIYVGC